MDRVVPRANVGIVGYRMGNVTSLRNALTAIGLRSFVAAEPRALDAATHIILPGVGAFPQAMENLTGMGFAPVLRRRVLEERIPFLGICLGMQVLATRGEEHREADGLGFIPGRVQRLATRGLPVPHVGWNDTHAARESRLLPAKSACFYYVHSYAMLPDDPSDATLVCDYGEPFVAAVERGNVSGVQFHPEKSHAAGLDLLRRFAEMEPC